MSITVSGLGSGLTYDSWITQLVAIKQSDIDKVSAKVTAVNSQESSLSQIKTDYTNLQAAIETFTKALSTTDVFNQKTVSSSSTALTATVNSTANVGTLSINNVGSLATATTAQSTYAVASYADSATTLNSIAGNAITAGTLSIYVAGAKTSLTINPTDTLGNVLTSLNAITGVSATLSADGKLTIGASSGTASPTVTVGSSADTSNFSNVMALTPTTTNGVTTYGSSKSIFNTNTTTPLTSTPFRNSNGTAATIGAGTFSIGGTSFTIDATTTLDGLISTINSSAAGVTASWNPNSGKLLLTSNHTGALSIDIQAGTSNFTDVMGLTSGGGLIPASQAMGTNATLTINGTTITSTSNTVTSDISGIKGLTLTLNSTTTSAANVSIAQDTSAASNAITKVVNALNTLISDTTTATGTNGKLYGESLLTSFKNKLRTSATANVPGAVGYTMLASIGITTGAIGTSVSADTNKLTIDTAALTTALTTNPDSVKKLLLGDATLATTGILTNLSTVVDNATNSANGYFVTRNKSYEAQKTNLNKKISTMTTNLAKYKTDLETRFSAMDKVISALKNSSSVFDSYFNKPTTSTNGK